MHHGIQQRRGRKASFTAAIISTRSDKDGNYTWTVNDLIDVMVKESADYWQIRREAEKEKYQKEVTKGWLKGFKSRNKKTTGNFNKKGQEW